MRDGIPGIADVPGLNHLFTKNHKEAQETDVVVMLTPHVLRVLDLTEDDLRPLRLSRDGTGPALIESAPTPAPPPIIRDPASESAHASDTANPVENPGPVRVRPVPAPPVIRKD